MPAHHRDDALLIGLGAFLLNVILAPSGLFWLDAGDFVTASALLGVPHPTGFPLYTLLGKLAALVPFGPIAFRLSLLSGVFAGVASGVVTLLLYQLTPSHPRPARFVAATLAAVALWLTDVGAMAGRTPDVYSLQLAALAGCLLLALRLYERYSRRTLWTLGLLTGLGMANHAEFRLFAPLFLLAALVAACRARRGRFVPALGGWLVAAGLGLTPYVYLLLAGRRGSYHVWGAPQSLGGVWEHVWGRSIRLGFEDEVLGMSGARLAQAASRLLDQVVIDFGWPLLVLASLGVVAVVVSHRFTGLLALAVLVADVAYSVAINPMGLADAQNGAPTYLVIVLGLGAAVLLGVRLLHAITRSYPLGVVRITEVLAATAVLLFALTTGSPAYRGLPGDWGAEDLGYEALQTVPSGALVLTDSEALAASRLYLAGVGGLRPDTQALSRHELYNGQILRQRQADGPFALVSADDGRLLEGGIAATEQRFEARLRAMLFEAWRHGRPVAWEGGRASDSAPYANRLSLGFPLHRLEASPLATPSVRPPHASLRAPASQFARSWLATYHNFVGAHAFRSQDLEAAARAFTVAAQLAPGFDKPLVNLGLVRALQGDVAEAILQTEAALRRNPLNAVAWEKLARYRCHLGRREGAARALAQALDLGLSEETAAEVREALEHCAR